MNSEKIILDLCGGTGSWSLPYKDAGYDVKIVTLPMQDIFSWNEYIDYAQRVYGILAAPDCSQFSLARNRHNSPRDLKGAFELIKRCLEIIWYCNLNGKLHFWCLENPKGLLVHLLGKPAFKFQRWEYSDWGKKTTYLWGDFNFPKKTPDPGKCDTTYISDWCYNDVVIPSDYVRPKGLGLKKIKRAITPPGFAAAFYKANK